MTYVSPDKIKTLEEYAFSLVTGIISLKTLLEFHATAIKIGILSEDQECRANTIAWDCGRLFKLYKEQMESVLELLPENLNFDSIIEKLKDVEVSKARQVIRNNKKK